jgi:hypothetical protein
VLGRGSFTRQAAVLGRAVSLVALGNSFAGNYIVNTHTSTCPYKWILLLLTLSLDSRSFDLPKRGDRSDAGHLPFVKPSFNSTSEVISS